MFIPMPTHYEPIRHTEDDFYLFINDALWGKGFPSYPVTRDNVYATNDTFNNYTKLYNTEGGTPWSIPYDHAFSVYIVYNPPEQGAPSTFADFGRGGAMYDGPFTLEMWNTANWYPSNLGRVITHETGHIFWACDEYAGGCTTCQSCFVPGYGPRNQLSTPWITNGNCELTPPTAECDASRSMCMMKMLDPYLCGHTAEQVGW